MSVKQRRQQAISRLIGQRAVANQPQLVELLAGRGITATQATVSRDLDELGAIKVRVPGGQTAYALPELEKQSIDIAKLERRRDFMVDGLTAMGYGVHRPEGTFYLFPRSPLADDEAFVRMLAEQRIMVLPGAVFETPGFFRICLTATDATCERALPGFAAAIGQARPA